MPSVQQNTLFADVEDAKNKYKKDMKSNMIDAALK